MRRFAPGIALLLLTALAWAQDPAPADDSAGAEAAAAGPTEPAADAPADEDTGDKAADKTADKTVDEATDEAADDSDLDLQTYEDDDDDFVPTEEIPSDVPIPFPSNI